MSIKVIQNTAYHSHPHSMMLQQADSEDNENDAYQPEANSKEWYGEQ